MSQLYRAIRWANSHWYWWLTAEIVATILLMIWGDATRDRFDLSSSLYASFQCFAFDYSPPGDGPLPIQCDIARWLGSLVGLSAVWAVVISLFDQPVLTLFVRLAARNHVIVTGLGKAADHTERLIIDLCESGRDVILLQEDRAHPSLKQCRDAGAIVLLGATRDSAQLKRAQLYHARHLLCLFEEDNVNLETALNARTVLNAGPPTPSGQPVRCAVQVGDPGVLGSVRKHKLYTDDNDRLVLEMFNMHEVTARAMLREAIPRSTRLLPRRILILGTGAKKRLGETLIVRAAQDWWIDHYNKLDADGHLTKKLEIDLYDSKATQWLEFLQERYPLLDKICVLRGRSCSPSRCGFEAHEPMPAVRDVNYDAAFVCLADELHAMVQAHLLAELLATHDPDVVRPPVVVRVLEREHGCGALLSQPDAGGLGKIMPVEIRGRVFDVETVLNPESEMQAQTMHEEYLRKSRKHITELVKEGKLAEAKELSQKPAVKFWNELDGHYRDSNRKLAERIEGYLAAVDDKAGRKTRRYKLRQVSGEFAAGNLIRINEFTPREVEFLAELEHQNWMDELPGWKYGEVRDDAKKRHPNLLPWDDPRLDESVKDYDREIVRRIPHVFAKAGYEVVPAQESSPQ